MDDIKLTLQQAIKIRDDFQYLEGEILDENGKYERQINRIIVGPFDEELYNRFSNTYAEHGYEDRDDEDDLAASFQPESYKVYTLYVDFQSSGVYMHENFLDTAKALELEIDLSKYGIRN